jgi:hypothetical protein
MDIKHHGTAAIVAASVATATISALPPKVVEHPLAVTISTSKHAWPDLADAEKAQLAERLKGLAGKKVEIFCDGADCRDLQTDLDDAFEDAGVAAERAAPFMPLGYGIQVIYGVGDYALASKLAADIKAVSGGRIAPLVASSVTAMGWRSRSASGRGS